MEARTCGVSPRWAALLSCRSGAISPFRGDGKTYTFSAMEDTAMVDVPGRVDVAHGPDSHFLDARGAFARTEYLASDGAAALKREADGWELIPARTFSEFGFAPELVGPKDDGIAFECLPLDGSDPVAPEVRWSRGMAYVIAASGKDVKYRLARGTSEPPRPIDWREICVVGVEAHQPTERLHLGHHVSETLIAALRGRRINSKGETLTFVPPCVLMVADGYFLQPQTAQALCVLDFRLAVTPELDAKEAFALQFLEWRGGIGNRGKDFLNVWGSRKE